MDLKTKVSIERVKKDGEVTREYLFLLPYGAPLGEVYDFCHEVLQEIAKMAQKAADSAKTKDEEPKA